MFSYDIEKDQARVWHEKTYLPQLSGKILYVGVGAYTAHYHQLTRTPHLFETVDHDGSKAAFGSPFKHYNVDFLDFVSSDLYDHVSLFGMMGHPITVTTSKYNIVDQETVRVALYKADSLVKLGGTLELGPHHLDLKEHDAKFWIVQFSKAPLDKYKVLFCAMGKDNFIWWGRKIQE